MKKQLNSLNPSRVGGLLSALCTNGNLKASMFLEEEASTDD